MYKLQVTKFVKNDNYEEEMKEYKMRTVYGNYSGNIDHPYDTKEERHLEVLLTDEEYEAIKQAVIKTFN